MLKLAGLRGASTCTEPEAAAIAYASRDRVPEGAKLAVYDLGGGTFDAAVLVRDGIGFRLIGNPDGVEHLGGIDFDAAVCQHVLDQLGPAVQQLDDSDPATLLGLNRLRRDCVTAKEALSSDDDTVIPVALPGHRPRSCRSPGPQFEEMVRPAIGETVSAMQRALGSAGVTPDELHAIVMVGGSSRIPLVARELTAAFGRPLALDNHPKHDVALGAAIRALEPGSPRRPECGARRGWTRPSGRRDRCPRPRWPRPRLTHRQAIVRPHRSGRPSRRHRCWPVRRRWIVHGTSRTPHRLSRLYRISRRGRHRVRRRGGVAPLPVPHRCGRLAGSRSRLVGERRRWDLSAPAGCVPA